MQYYSVLGKLLVLETERPVEAVLATLLEKMRGRKEAEGLLAAHGDGGVELRAAHEQDDGAEDDNWGIT